MPEVGPFSVIDGHFSKHGTHQREEKACLAGWLKRALSRYRRTCVEQSFWHQYGIGISCHCSLLGRGLSNMSSDVARVRKVEFILAREPMPS